MKKLFVVAIDSADIKVYNKNKENVLYKNFEIRGDDDAGDI